MTTLKSLFFSIHSHFSKSKKHGEFSIRSPPIRVILSMWLRQFLTQQIRYYWRYKNRIFFIGSLYVIAWIIEKGLVIK